MNSEVRLLFHRLADLSPEERERAFQELGSGPELRAEVESLLKFDLAQDSDLTGSVSRAAVEALASEDARELSRCGPYRLDRLLGSGGMGAVYLAERSDGEVQQKVAVKLLRAGEHRAGLRQRFLKERQFLASLGEGLHQGSHTYAGLGPHEGLAEFQDFIQRGRIDRGAAVAAHAAGLGIIGSHHSNGGGIALGLLQNARDVLETL